MVHLIFDCDGVLAETERDGHRVAFNHAFETCGLDLRWSQSAYGELLAIGGGKERLAATLATADETRHLSTDARADLVKKLHRVKTDYFVTMARDGKLPARPGIRRVVRAGLEAGWTLAVASTSAPSSVRTVLESSVTPELATQFAGVFAGDVVSRKKPAPDIYLHALKTLDASPEDTTVVEDSAIGSAAATAAGLGHLITISSYTADEDFSGAAMVVSSLGDDSEPTRWIRAPESLASCHVVELSHLLACAHG
jgi:HAD superfamily hydrolase (TIGR01509 family)